MEGVDRRPRHGVPGQGGRPVVDAEAGRHGRRSTPARAAGSRSRQREGLQQFVDAWHRGGRAHALHAQRQPGRGGRPPAPARRPARGARRHQPQGRLLAVGAVRVLHGAARRQAGRWPAPSGSTGSTARTSPPSRACRPTSATATRPPSPPPGALQCGFCTPGIVMRTKYLVDKDGPALTREKAARHLGGHLCRCTGYHPILDAVDLLASGAEVPVRGRRPRPSGGGRAARRRRPAVGSRASTRPASWRSATRTTSTTCGSPACSTPPPSSPSTPGPTSSPSTPRRPRPSPASSGSSRPPTCPATCASGSSTATGRCSSPSAGARRTPATSWPSSWPADRATARRAAELVEVDYAAARPVRRRRSSALDSTEPAVWQVGDPAAPNVLSRSAYARSDDPDGLDVDAALAASAHTVHEVFQTQRIEHAFLEPESTLAVPHDDGTLEVFSRRPGRVGRPPPDRRRARHRRGPRPRAPRRQRRRLRRQGGLRQPDPDRRWPPGCCGRPVKCTFSREESLLRPPQAPPGAGRGVGRMRRRRPGHRAQGRASSATPGPYASVGHEGARAGRRPRQRALRLARRRRRGGRRPHQQPRRAAPSGASAPTRPSSPPRACSTGWPTPAGIDRWEIRARNVVMPGRDLGARARSWTTAASAPATASTPSSRRYDDAVAAGKAVGRRARPQELGPRQRVQGGGEGGRPVRRRTARSRSATAGPRWARACTPSPSRWRCEELGVDPADRSGCSSTRPGSWAPARRPGAGARSMGAGSVAAACRGGVRRRLPAGRRLRGRVPRRLDPGHRHGRAARRSTRRSATPPSSWSWTATPATIERVVAAHDVGRAVNPLLCEGQVIGVRAHGPRLRADRGLPDRRRGPARPP